MGQTLGSYCLKASLPQTSLQGVLSTQGPHPTLKTSLSQGFITLTLITRGSCHSGEGLIT